MTPPITLEKPKSATIQFHEIEKLREELRKQSKNKERLAEFEVTINEALKEGNKKGLIEFTKEEWNSLITNENLPPIEEVKTLLRRKIEARKEITAETQVEQKGFFAEMREKGTQKLQQATEKGKELITGTKAEIEEKIKKNKEKIKKFGKLAFLGTAALSIGLSMKIWGYKILKFLSFGLYNPEEAISKIEKEKFILEHPEEAVKKYGQEVVDAIKKGTTGVDGEKKGAEEGREGMLENAKGPLKILAGIIGLGAATGAIGRLTGGKEGSKILNLVPGLRTARTITSIGLGSMKFIGRLGVLGLVGYGAYRLYEHFEKNPHDLADAGENPDKSWWSKMIDKVWGNDPKNAKTEREKKYLLSFVSGEKKIEEVQEDEHPEGMEGMGDKMKKVVDETSEPFHNFLDTVRDTPELAAIVGTTIGYKIGFKNIFQFTRMTAEIAINLAKTAFWGMPLTAIFGVMAYLLWKKIDSESVPKDPKEFEDFMLEHSEEMEEYCKEQGILSENNTAVISHEKLREAASYIAVPEKIKNVIGEKLGKLGDLVIHAGKEYIGESPEAIEKAKNLQGIHYMMRKIDPEKKENEQYKTVYKKLSDLAEKITKIDLEKNTLEIGMVVSGDINEIKEACKNTDIIIDTHHGYVTWGHGEYINGELIYSSTPRRLCIDPAVTDKKERHDLAKEFRTDTEGNYITSFYEAGVNDTRYYVYALSAALEEGKDDEAKGILDHIIQNRAVKILGVGKDFFIEGAEQQLIELPVNTIRLLLGMAGAKDMGLTIQEFAVQHGNGIIPMYVVAGLGKAVLSLGHSGIIESHESILKSFTGRLGLLGRGLNIVGRGAVMPFVDAYKMTKNVIKYGGKTLKSPLQMASHVAQEIRLKGKYAGASILEDRKWFVTGNSAEIANAIRGRYVVEHLNTKGISDALLTKNLKSLEDLLKATPSIAKNGLEVNGKKMRIKQIKYEISRRLKNKESLDDILHALDNHISTLKLDVLKNFPNVRKIVDAMKKIAGSTPAKIDKIIGDLLKSGNTNWPKMMAKMEQMNPGTSGAFMAYMLYDLHHSEDKGKTVIEHTAGWVGFLAGRKATKATVGKLFKNPLVQEILGLVGGVSASMFGTQIISPEAIEGKIGEWLDTGEFTHAIFNQASDLEYIAGARILAKSKLGNTILKVGAKRLGLELLAKKVSQKIAGTLIEKFIIKLGQKIGLIAAERGTVAAGAAWIPVAGWVFDAGLAIWTTVDVCLITNMVVKAQTMKTKHESQSKKPIKNVSIDRRGEESIADMVKIHEGKDYNAMTEAEKDDAKLKYFEQVARCNITIERDDGSIETYGYAAGNPTYAKIQEKDGTVTELTKEDLNQAETWELPNNYRTEKIPYKDLPPEQLMFYYGIQVQKLKIATQWQQLDAKVESDKKVTVSREHFTHDTISIERQPDNTWQLVSNKRKAILSGKHDFHGALALAGLVLYSMEFLVKEVKEKGDNGWKSEDGTLTPFSSDKNSVNYAKDDAMDKDFIEKWLPFYENNLKLRPSQIVQALNTYFGAIGKDLDLIGD